MKRIIIICALILCSGCSISDDLDIHTQLEGKWDWVESTGGIEGRTDTPANTGKTIFIEISSTTVKKYVNGILESELNFEIQFGASMITNYKTYLIIYDNGMKQSIGFAENNLILFDECIDCFRNEYIKN